MALRNPKIFGLNVSSNFVDVKDKTIALGALNLPINDLDVIRGSRNYGVTSTDWINLSRLIDPIYKTLDRFQYDSSVYGILLGNTAGTDSTLFGNLNINGALSGQVIRYRYVDGSGSSATIRIADISTSRVSAWISAGSGTTAAISYGARVGIITGGTLQFGTPTSANQIRLQTSTTPQRKIFSSEVATHKVNCTIGGKTVSLYLMKGIPLVFTGTFRTLRPSITLNGVPPSNARPGWRIIETANPLGFTTFITSGSTSTINYVSTASRERNIEFYYNPDNITGITINNANITAFPPEVVLPNLTNLNLTSNQIKEFPDLNVISPNIQKVYLNQNPFYLSGITTERRFDSILYKIPAGAREIVLGSTFSGSIGTNSIGNRFTDLRYLSLQRPTTSQQYFYADNSNLNSSLPNVSNTCEIYEVNNNDFRTIAPSSGNSKNIKELDSLITLDLRSNYNLTDPNFSISPSNQTIENIYISSTNLPCPDLSGKQSLKLFYANACRNVGFLTTTGGNYKFDGCNSLTYLTISDSNLSGRLPTFTNQNLETILFRSSRLTGGATNGDTSYVIPETTFESCPKLKRFDLTSPNLLTSPIHPNVFTFTQEINSITYSSSGRTTGGIPNLSSCSNLLYLNLSGNNLNTTEIPVPNFISNPNIYYINLSYNSLSGNIPGFRNLLSLTDLYLNNNQFTSLSTFQNLPKLAYFYANNNQLSGIIPNFSQCTKLAYLVLFNNQFTDYTSGSLSALYFLQYLDVSSNSLSQQSVNSIIGDLYTNYNTVKRGRVTVNLRGNAIPGEFAINQINFLRSKGWTIVYQ